MHLTDTPPAFCSSCYGQYPDRLHVDFEASYDGPVIEGGVVGPDGNVLSRIPVTIDELVLCEECVRAAAAQLGEAPADPKVQQTVEELEALKRDKAAQDEYVRMLEGALAARPKPAQQRKKQTQAE